MPTHKEVGYPGGARRGGRFNPPPAAHPVLAAEPEENFQTLVIETAELHGWMVYHTLRSLGSEAGFPDLILVRGRRLLAVELKKVGRAPTMEQVRWLLALARAGVECYAWDATDTDTVMEVLA